LNVLGAEILVLLEGNALAVSETAPNSELSDIVDEKVEVFLFANN